VEEAIAQLQEATESVRERLSELAPVLARDPESRQGVDRFLFLEELTLEVGRIVDEMKAGAMVTEQGA